MSIEDNFFISRTYVTRQMALPKKTKNDFFSGTFSAEIM